MAQSAPSAILMVSREFTCHHDVNVTPKCNAGQIDFGEGQAGIHDGDLLVVDRAGAAVDGHIIVARLGDEMCVKRLRVIERKYWLYSENPNYPPIEITEEMDFETWGRVMHALRSF